jgi:hypothetical protein
MLPGWPPPVVWGGGFEPGRVDGWDVGPPPGVAAIYHWAKSTPKMAPCW